MRKPIRMVLVGAGFIGREHVSSAKRLDSVEYVGVVDITTTAATSLAGDYDLPAFARLEQAIEELKPDAADICVPTPYHLEQIEICGRHGVHALCEKPIERSVEQARAIVDVVANTGIRVMVAQVIRFWPEYRHVREMAASGQYGDILSVDCKRLSSPPGWSGWLMDGKQSGGAVIDLQIHDMDFVLQLLGKPRTITTIGRDWGGGINGAVTLLGYPSGIPVQLESSFLMPLSYPFRMFFKIEFEKAIAEMDFWREKGQRLRIYPAEGEPYCPDLLGKDAYRDEIDYFCRQLATGEPFDLVPLEESVLALEMCCMSSKSSETGMPVSV